MKNFRDMTVEEKEVELHRLLINSADFNLLIDVPLTASGFTSRSIYDPDKLVSVKKLVRAPDLANVNIVASIVAQQVSSNLQNTAYANDSPEVIVRAIVAGFATVVALDKLAATGRRFTSASKTINLMVDKIWVTDFWALLRADSTYIEFKLSGVHTSGSAHDDYEDLMIQIKLGHCTDVSVPILDRPIITTYTHCRQSYDSRTGWTQKVFKSVEPTGIKTVKDINLVNMQKLIDSLRN